MATPSTPQNRPSKRPRKVSRRTSGSIRALPSGRYQARYTAEDGHTRTAPSTFATKREADTWLATYRADLVRGTWRDPEAGSITLADYLTDWLASRTDLAPRTVQTYRGNIARWLTADLHRSPHGTRSARHLNLGDVELRNLTPALVREWHAAAVYSQELGRATRKAAADTNARDRWPTAPIRAWARETGRPVGRTGRLSPSLVAAWQKAGRPMPGPVTASVGQAPRPTATIAQAYRTLRAALNDAVTDGHIPTNPCQLPRAAEVKAAERKHATPSEVDAIASAMPAHLSAAVHVAAYTGLRAGELFALTRAHVDLDAGTLRVDRALLELHGQPVTFGPPKTDSSRRTVHMPPHVTAILRDHLDAHARKGAGALVFAQLDGTPLPTHRRTALFARARKAADRPDLRWHDLRHTGATLAAQAGASIRELQHRLGHSTYAAAMRYQHASHERDREVADRLSVLAGHGPTATVIPFPHHATASAATI